MRFSFATFGFMAALTTLALGAPVGNTGDSLDAISSLKQRRAIVFTKTHPAANQVRAMNTRANERVENMALNHQVSQTRESRALWGAASSHQMQASRAENAFNRAVRKNTAAETAQQKAAAAKAALEKAQASKGPFKSLNVARTSFAAKRADGRVTSAQLKAQSANQEAAAQIKRTQASEKALTDLMLANARRNA